MTYRLIVSEPWNFCSRQGDNVIVGEVLRKLDNRHLLFKTDEVVSFKNQVGRHLLLSSRFEEQEFFNEPYQGTVNGQLLTHSPSEVETLDDILFNSSFAIIGNLNPGGVSSP